ncbi:PsbP-related protein [Chloroflexota bacterium]
MQRYLTVLFVALLATVVVACGQPESTPTRVPTTTPTPTPSPTSIPIPTPTPTPTPIPTMLPGPTSAPSTPTGSATPGYTRVYDHELGFGFEYPEDWETQTPEVVDGEDVVSIAMFTKPGTPTTLIVTVRLSDLTSLEEVKEEIKEGLKELGLTVLEERGIVVIGREGYEVIYKPIAVVKMRQVMFIADGKRYMLVCSTAEVLYDEYRDTFDDIVNSFVIK